MSSFIPIEVHVADRPTQTINLDPEKNVTDLVKQCISNKYFRDPIRIQEVNVYAGELVDHSSSFNKVMKANQNQKLKITLVDTRRQQNDKQENTDKFLTSLSQIKLQQSSYVNQESWEQSQKLIGSLKSSITEFVQKQRWDIPNEDNIETYTKAVLQKAVQQKTKTVKKNIEKTRELRQLKEQLKNKETQINQLRVGQQSKQEQEQLAKQPENKVNIPHLGFLLQVIEHKQLDYLTGIKINAKTTFKFSSFFNLLESFQDVTNILLVCTFQNNDDGLAFYQPSSIAYKKVVKKRQNQGEELRGRIIDLKRRKAQPMQESDLILLSKYSVQLCRNVLLIEPSNKKNLNTKLSIKGIINKEFWQELGGLGELSGFHLYEVKK